MNRTTGVQPRVMLSDITQISYIQSDDRQLWYNNVDNFLNIKPCQVKITDLFKYDSQRQCHISQCGSGKCKTCDILDTSGSFTSSLTRKTYFTQGVDDISCKTCNVVYGIICTLCGLVYVGETKGQLNKRISGHRYQINNDGNQLLYQHFNQPDHSVISMKVTVIEKIYHHTNSPTLSTPFRRQREEYWIKELGTAHPYGCNDNISSIGNLTSPSCSTINVMNLFPSFHRRQRSHGHRHYTPARFNDISFSDLLEFLNKPLGIHHIRTKLFSIPLASLNKIYRHCLESHYSDNSREYRLSSIILDIGNTRLFKSVSSDSPVDISDGRFMKVHFANKGIDAINISNILHHKDVMRKVPPYFKNQSAPKVSYTYTSSIASKIFNYKQSLCNFHFDNGIPQLPTCSCSASPFLYQPAGHVVTGDLNIVENHSLRNLLMKGPKYRENRSFNWKYNFKLVMDSVEEYARGWAKQEGVEADTLSEWIKSIRHLLKRRIYMVSRSMNTDAKSIFSDAKVIKHLTDLHDRFVLVPADKASNNIVFVCKAYFYSCLSKELNIGGDGTSSTYQQTALSKDEILSNHSSVLSSFGISTKSVDSELPSLYWIPKLHKNPYKQRFIAHLTVLQRHSLNY